MNRADRVSQAHCKQAVKEKLESLYSLIEEHYSLALSCRVDYSLRGTRAGTALSRRKFGRVSIKPSENIIRLNLGMLQDPILHDDMVNDTVAHELAHIVCHHLHPKARGHNQWWRSIALTLAGTGKRTHDYDVSAHRIRKMKRFQYQCSNPQCAKDYELSAIRHNRVLRGASYYCAVCGEDHIIKTVEK